VRWYRLENADSEPSRFPSEQRVLLRMKIATMCSVTWPRYVRRAATRVTSRRGASLVSSNPYPTDIVWIKNNWKATGRWGGCLVGQKRGKHADPVALVARSRLGRLFWNVSLLLFAFIKRRRRRRRRKPLSSTPTEGFLSLFVCLSEGGEYKVTCAQPRVAFRTLEQKEIT